MGARDYCPNEEFASFAVWKVLACEEIGLRGRLFKVVSPVFIQLTFSTEKNKLKIGSSINFNRQKHQNISAGGRKN